MTSETLKLARLKDRADRRAQLLDLATHVVGNPLVLGLAAIAANQAAYQAGWYDKLPARSVLGGPVWMTIGSADTPATDRWAKIDGLIVSATVALAFSGGVKGIMGGLSSLKALAVP